MYHMYRPILWAVLVLLLAPFWVRAADEVPGVATYEAYTSSVKRVCLGEGSTSDVATPWKEARQNPLVTYVHVDYPDILSPDSDAAFKNIVDRVKGDKESLNAEIDAAKEANVFASQIEKSSILYASRMNTLYACAILNTKLRANTRILEEFRPQGSNIISQVERSTEQMRRRLGELQCRDVSKESTEWASISLSRDLINATTGEYCNYRHYLSYVDTVVSNRLSEVIAVEEATRKKQGGTATGGISERFPEAQDIAIALSGAKSRASAEITRTKAVYGEAFDAYREFDRHYVSHVLSFFIEDRLLVLRSYLRQTLNPIGQVIYLGSNAQKPG